MTKMPTAAALADAILALLAKRAAGKSICPSDVARMLRPDGNWRALMPGIRAAAATLARRGVVEIQQGGKRVPPTGYTGPIRIIAAPHASDYHGVDFRAEPERYRVGRGEQGVLSAEPYKSELLPLWRFQTPALARISARALWAAFVAYREAGDGVGMDMARKFLQMGFTRSRRYAKSRSGTKRGVVAPVADPEKAKCAEIFYAAWQRAARDRAYKAWRVKRHSRNSPTGAKPRPR